MKTIQPVTPENLLKYARQWIAVTSDHTQIVAAGRTVSEVESKLTDDELAQIVLKYVPAPEQVLSPLCRS